MMCRYAQSCAFISVIELPRIPAYCPKAAATSSKLIAVCRNKPALLIGYHPLPHTGKQVCHKCLSCLFFLSTAAEKAGTIFQTDRTILLHRDHLRKIEEETAAAHIKTSALWQQRHEIRKREARCNVHL